MGSSFTQLYYHFVWTTYKRSLMINDEIETYLERLIRDKIIEHNSELLAFGCTKDHVHLLVRLHPSQSVAGIIGVIKGYTSYVLANRFQPDLGFRWQGGYGAFTVPERDLMRLTKYLERQKEHHQEKPNRLIGNFQLNRKRP